MITNEGKNHIRRYLAGYVPAIAQSMVFGIGATTETGADTTLTLEVARSAIVLTSYDFVNNRLIFKAPVPDDYTGKVYEIGIYSLLDNPAAGDFGSRNITTFDSTTEDWVDAGTSAAETFVSTNTRIGIDSLSHTPALSTTKTSSLRDVTLDFSGNSGADSFTFALNVGNNNTNSVTVRFMTDASNYYSLALGTGVQTSGYKIISVTKSAATTTGTPNWGNITEIQVATNSKASGASAVELDAIRLEDKDSINLDYVLVARKVLVSPFTKVDGAAQDAEFTLDVALP